MNYESTRLKALVWITVSGALSLGCPADDPPPVADSSTGEVDSSTSASSVSVSASGQDTIGSADSTVGVDSTTGMADGSFLDPSTSTSGGSNPMPNGSPCMGEQDCESEFCYDIPMLGGVCSECLTDEDCGKGTCAIDAVGYAICTDGSIGLMCSSDEGCMGELVCSELVDTGGVFPANFCSECRDDDVPCMDGQICSPVYDLQNLAGYLGCVDPMSVENGGGCPINGVMGDGTVCMSGACGVATLFGLIPIGVCGECVTDMDCVDIGLTTCTPPSADMAGIMPAVCV